MTAPGDGGGARPRPSAAGRGGEGDPERVVIRDKRRFDPVTGEPRTPDPAGDATAPPVEAPVDVPVDVPSNPLGADDVAGADDEALTVTREMELELALAERTADAQRVAADFANYRRRMDRDREVLAQVAVAGAMVALLPVLDDVDRARSHGDLTGAFKAVADGLDAALANAGVEAFGEPGDEFDPAFHEAVTHDTSADVERPTATVVMRRGYRLGERLLRPAMVGVTAPE